MMNPTTQNPRPRSTVELVPPTNSVANTPDTDELLLKAELLELSMSGESELIVCEAFRKLAMQYGSAIGACQVHRDDNGDWDVSPKNRTGRVPRRNDFQTEVGNVCEQACVRNTVQIKRFETMDAAQAIIMPAHSNVMRPEVFLLVVPRKQPLAKPLRVLKLVVESLLLWQKGRVKSKDDWKLSSLAAIIELVSRIESCPSRQEAGTLIANDLAKHLRAKVAVGFADRKHRLAAISGITKIDRNSETANAFLQTIHEAELRQLPGTWPPVDDEGDGLLLAHKQLGSLLQAARVHSQTFASPCGTPVGVVVVVEETESPSNRVGRFLLAATPRIATAVNCVHRGRESRLRIVTKKTAQIARSWKTRICVCMLVAIVALMFVPVTYKVRCNAVVDAKQKRYAVAPFDGIIEQVYVESGDTVSEGQLLATFDGRPIRWELAGLTAERESARKKADMELVDRNVANSLLQSFERQRLEARQNVLNYQNENLNLKSPIDGVVLTGSKEQNESSSVELGDVLFEVGRFDSMIFEVEIPSNEIGQVEEGMEVTLWVEGHEHTPIVGKIRKLSPRSELRNANNVFIGEVVVPSGFKWLRPGMKATAKIKCVSRPLGWNLFHKPYNFVKTRLLSW